MGVSRGCNDRWRHQRHDVQRHAFLRPGKACSPGVHVLGQATIGGCDVYINLNSCSSAVQMLSLIVLRCTVMLIFNGPPLYSDPNQDPNQPSNLTPAFAFLFHMHTPRRTCTFPRLRLIALSEIWRGRTASSWYE